MANISFSNVEVICTSAEWSEIVQYLKSPAANWPPTYDGIDFGTSSFSYSMAWSDKAESGGYLSSLSACYPSAIFIWENNVEGTDFERKHYLGGEEKPKSQMPQLQKKIFNQEANRFLNTKSDKSRGIYHEVQLLSDGTLAAIGKNIFGECDISGWGNIIQISCGSWHTVGLRQDGRIVACGSNINQQCSLNHFSNIIEISCGRYHTAVLRRDGTVGVASAENSFSSINQWTNVIRIFSIFDTIIGIQNDQTILLAGDICPVSANTLKRYLGENIILPIDFICKDEFEKLELARKKSIEEISIQKKYLKADAAERQEFGSINADLVNGYAFPKAAKKKFAFHITNSTGDILIHYSPMAYINRIEKTRDDYQKHNVYLVKTVSQKNIYGEFLNLTTLDHFDNVQAELEYLYFLKICLIYTNSLVAKSVYETAAKTKSGLLHIGKVQHLAYLPVTIDYKFYELVATNVSNNEILIEIRRSTCTMRYFDLVKELPDNKEILNKWNIIPVEDKLPIIEASNPDVDIAPELIYDYQTYSGEKVATIKKYKAKNQQHVVIPDEIEGCRTTKIGKGAFRNSDIESLVLGQYVDTIDESAFEGCSRLKTIQLPDSVKSIGSRCFFNCVNLENVVLSGTSSLNLIATSAFEGCKNLTNINLPPSVSSIEERAFYNCYSLKEIHISEKIEKISTLTFFNCWNLTFVSIPKSVKEIEYGAFNCCERLVDVDIGYYDIIIRRLAFVNTGLAKHGINKANIREIDGLIIINGTTILCCTGEVIDLKIPDGITNITEVIKDARMHHLRIPSSVKNIVPNALSGTDVETVQIEDGVEEIGDCAFKSCQKLKSIILPKSIKHIGEEAFSDCTSLVRIAIPEGIRDINLSAFCNCSSLREVTLPSSLREIKGSAFRNCTLLTNINVTDNVCVIARNSFQDSGVSYNARNRKCID